jgi:hypothetical protein
MAKRDNAVLGIVHSSSNKSEFAVSVIAIVKNSLLARQIITSVDPRTR